MRFNRKELINKLLAKGYKTDKSRISRDVKAGLYAPGADGKFDFAEVEDLYAVRKTHTTPVPSDKEQASKLQTAINKLYSDRMKDKVVMTPEQVGDFTVDAIIRVVADMIIQFDDQDLQDRMLAAYKISMQKETQG